MNKADNRLKKYIYNLLIISFLIILVNSVEAFFYGKSHELFQSYLKLNPGSTSNDYISIVLINYFLSIIEVVLIAVFTVFTYEKFGITRLYKLIFGALIFLRIFNTLIKFNLSSVFYFVGIAFYIILFILIIRAPMKNREVHHGLH